jgi:hypothetical protein
MKSIYAYLATFEILDAYWRESKVDGLRSVLSAMNPDPLYETPYVSADPGVFADWTAGWDKVVGAGKEGTAAQAFRVAKGILDYYSVEVGYDLGDAEDFLRSRLKGLPRALALAS